VEDKGFTLIDVPEPAPGPPQMPEYQFQEAPVPNEPPVTESVELLPAQTGLGKADMLPAATEFEFTVTITLAQVVVLQVPLYRT